MQNSMYSWRDFDFKDSNLGSAIILEPDDSDESRKGVIFRTRSISSHALKTSSIYKFFRSGMRDESQQNNGVSSMTIDVHEKAALIEIINFMYFNTLIATSPNEVVNVLIMANKLEDSSCLRYCVQKLLEFPISKESAVVYLNLPSCLLANELVRPLINASKNSILEHYKDFTRTREEALKQPLLIIEMILESVSLQVPSEDEVFDFIIEWGTLTYPNPQKFRKIITKLLVSFISFKDLSPSKLREALNYDFSSDQNTVSKLVQEALFYKAERQPNMINGHQILSHDSKRRVYLSNPCVLYYGLKKEDLKRHDDVVTRLCSLPFNLDGSWFNLNIERSSYLFGLYVDRIQTGYLLPREVIVDFEVAMKNKFSMEFDIMWNRRNVRLDLERTDLLNITRGKLNTYYIDDVIYLRVRVNVNKLF